VEISVELEANPWEKKDDLSIRRKIRKMVNQQI
jgi:hypothetical protein